ncbi:MAG: hypothetical protein M1536_05460, partial [Firmicutes bacterium]|nr:hypothetical protein [Bacillota bacterium]
MDLSELDKKYFIDPHKYNCPFCKRNHVSYRIRDVKVFDWTEEKTCAVFFVLCESCSKTSLHFSFKEIR